MAHNARPCGGLRRSSTQPISRREALASLTLAGAALLAQPSRALADSPKRLGLAEFSYIVRQRKENRSEKYPRFANAIELHDHLHDLGFGGMQVPLRGWN